MSPRSTPRRSPKTKWSASESQKNSVSARKRNFLLYQRPGPNRARDMVRCVIVSARCGIHHRAANRGTLRCGRIKTAPSRPRPDPSHTHSRRMLRHSCKTRSFRICPRCAPPFDAAIIRQGRAARQVRTGTPPAAPAA